MKLGPADLAHYPRRPRGQYRWPLSAGYVAATGPGEPAELYDQLPDDLHAAEQTMARIVTTIEPQRA